MTYGTLISTVTVGAGGANTLIFSSIPQTFTDLYLVASARATSTNTGLIFWFNGYGTYTYTSRFLQGTGTGVSTGTNFAGTGQGGLGKVSFSTDTSNTFANNAVYIPNYAGSTNKSFSVDSVTENNGTTAFETLDAGLATGTAAVSSITVGIGGSGSNPEIAQYSTFSLYGIK
jgi:hypothetical protein